MLDVSNWGLVHRKWVNFILIISASTSSEHVNYRKTEDNVLLQYFMSMRNLVCYVVCCKVSIMSVIVQFHKDFPLAVSSSNYAN